MYLNEVVKLSQESGKGFTRKTYVTSRESIKDPDYTMWLYATNSILATVLVDADEHVTPRWQPTLEDLTADDWIIYG